MKSRIVTANERGMFYTQLNYVCGMIYYDRKYRLVRTNGYGQAEEYINEWKSLIPFTTLSDLGVLTIAINHLYLRKGIDIPMGNHK